MDDDTKSTASTGAPRCDLSDEETMCSLMASTFRGKMGWISLLAYVYIVIFVGLAIVAAILFFRAETVRGMILAATGFVLSFGIVSLVKMWMWSFMWRNSIIRRIDRLERRMADAARCKSE